MEIRIHIPRPLILLTIIIFIVLWSTGVLQFSLPHMDADDDAIGGERQSERIVEARRTIDRESVRREVLERREEILRYQFVELDKNYSAASTEEEKERLREARKNLLNIIQERKKSEELISRSLLQLWEAEGTTFTTEKQTVAELLAWPVQPALGISAHFQDQAYEARFGFAHNAIDIPVAQGSTIVAPAKGVVEEVALNGLGYSYITVGHDNGVQTTFGHISSAAVTEGETVLRGQTIAQSGGAPGTEGAGLLTTGPHLHFAVRQDGVLVDPLQYLPKLR